MGSHVHYFSMKECPKEDLSDKIGIRGIRAIELAQLKMPILPGIIIDTGIATKLDDVKLSGMLQKFSEKAEKETGKKYNDPNNPAIYKIVISPSMEIVRYPSIHTIGLTDKTLEGFKKMVGEHFAYQEYAKFLIKGTLSLLINLEKDKVKKKTMIQIVDDIEVPKKIEAKNFTDQILKEISLTEEKLIIEEIYKKDAKSNTYKFSLAVKNKQKILDTLSYLEHKPIASADFEKYTKKHVSRILNTVCYYRPEDVKHYLDIVDSARKILPTEFFQDAYFQLEFLLKKVSHFLKQEEMDDEDSAIMVQPMVYGNYGKDSFSGKFYTRDIVSGEKILQGDFFQDKFDDTHGGDSNNINKIDAKVKKELEKVAEEVECYFKEIRQIKFTIERGRLWIIEQIAVMTKSTQATLKSLLYLLKKKIISEEHILRTVQPSEMSDILHPVINKQTAKKMKTIEGGIAGAPGAARGRVYFSTDSLMEADKKAIAEEQERNFILCLPATYAEDVKGIEVSNGVLSCEGGYSAHASVVARQYGKVSLVKPEMKIDSAKKQFTIDSVVVKEGDYITLDVPYYGNPEIIIGKADLIEPNPESSGLLELLEIINKYLSDFRVLGNGDSPKDAALIRKFGGEGIGLCRTEHMFFNEKRINIFREMIISDNDTDRKKALVKLEKMQIDDFYGIFKTMNPYPVTIRLLDAPLHEFLPHTGDELQDLMDHLKKVNPKITKAQVEAKIESIAEVNPMLGHRGCRVAISYPEIYEMQLKAIFKAAYKLQAEGMKVVPEIMIPIVMNIQELKFVKNGKKIEGESIDGISQIEKQIKEEVKAKGLLEYKVGTMIELPAAVLSAGEIAQYAEFFSFGTNDLTQTTHGLSRDDFNSFMPDYSKYDIIDANPFQVLTTPVKEMVLIASQRGRLTRPDLKLGLCGEQGADPRNLKFLKEEAGLNYVSCSSYSIPIAKLAVARLEIGQE
ncbi:MAG: PEP-utilizing enzyme [Spirochaetes bacterium]|nr:PEP-utilizing enzyme [Spirochaetota bacterium]